MQQKYKEINLKALFSSKGSADLIWVIDWKQKEILATAEIQICFLQEFNAILQMYLSNSHQLFVILSDKLLNTIKILQDEQHSFNDGLISSEHAYM